MLFGWFVSLPTSDNDIVTACQLVGEYLVQHHANYGSPTCSVWRRGAQGAPWSLAERYAP